MGIFNGPWLSKEEHERFVHLNLIGHVNSLELNNSELQAKLELAESRIAELEAALEPFADKADEYDNPCFPYHDSSLQTGLPVGWLRQARKVLENAAADWESSCRALGEKGD